MGRCGQGGSGRRGDHLSDHDDLDVLRDLPLLRTDHVVRLLEYAWGDHDDTLHRSASPHPEDRPDGATLGLRCRLERLTGLDVA